MSVTPQSSVTALYGVSESRAALLAKLDIATVDDLVRHYPRAYENRGDVKKVCEITAGQTVSLLLTIDSPLKSSRIPSRGRTLTVQKVSASDDTGAVSITFFNQDYLKNVMVTGRKFRFYGQISGGFLMPQMNSPAFEPYRDGVHLDNLVPIYPLTAGITGNMITKLIKTALPYYHDTESLPPEILTEFSLCPLYTALHDIHFPNDAENMEKARRRLAFEELLNFQLRLRALKDRGRTGKAYRFYRPDMTPFFDSLPYSLTDAQKRTIDEMVYDMTRREKSDTAPEAIPPTEYTEPMRRLVQGDVGSGKTIVAAAAVYVCVKNGCQAALMAPTEILAEQHYKSLLPLTEKHHIATALLTGSTKAAEKKKISEALAQGKIDFIIGTHALIEDTVVFARPGLTVTDEQHRFGVRQRQKLSEKSGADNTAAHMLVMSATPIPRTLAMILYGDLDISIIDELPPGRQKVDTFAVGEPMRRRIYAFIEKQAAQGHQCYIVCPLAQKSEDEQDEAAYDTELKSAKEYCETLKTEVFPSRRVSFIHGKMKSAEKEKIMHAFSDGLIDILVSTTVIEVGVNVPNATLMVVENAERFGLSQLHQLRGRVGRGKDKSYCVLMSPLIDGERAADRNEVEKRLGILCRYESGFKIAEFDLQNRGPGDFFGHRQHGEMHFKIADLAADMTLIEQTKSLADRLDRQKKTKGDATS